MCIVRHKRVYLKIPSIGECRYKTVLGSVISNYRVEVGFCVHHPSLFLTPSLKMTFLNKCCVLRLMHLLPRYWHRLILKPHSLCLHASWTATIHKALCHPILNPGTKS